MMILDTECLGKRDWGFEIPYNAAPKECFDWWEWQALSYFMLAKGHFSSFSLYSEMFSAEMMFSFLSVFIMKTMML